MANISTVYPPEIWARESIMILERNQVVANLVHRDFENEIAERGDVVNTRKPSKFTAQNYTNSITSAVTVQHPQATNIAVTLDTHKDVTFGITGRDKDTSIAELIEDFIQPAIEPIARAVDDDLLGANGLTNSGISDVTAAGAAIVFADLVAVQKKLLDNEVPFSSFGGVSRISFVMSTEHHSEVIQIASIGESDKSGLIPPPILTGFVTTALGMNFYVDQGVPFIPGSTARARSVAFHRNAVALITRPLDSSMGAEFGIRVSVMQKNGVGVRVMQSFQQLNKRWLTSFDILYGIAVLDALLATKLRDSAAG